MTFKPDTGNQYEVSKSFSQNHQHNASDVCCLESYGTLSLLTNHNQDGRKQYSRSIDNVAD